MQAQQSKPGTPTRLLLVFFGMIATGKSYLASAWAAKHGLPYYNSDRVRKDLAGLAPNSSQQQAVDQGIYTPAFSRKTYDALLAHAEHHFQEDPEACVVLDGSYQSEKERSLLRHHFSGRARLLFVHCVCAEEVVKKRLAQRAQDPEAVSDGSWEIYLVQKKRFQPLTAEEKEQVIVLDTDAPLGQLLERVDHGLSAHGL